VLCSGFCWGDQQPCAEIDALQVEQPWVALPGAVVEVAGERRENSLLCLWSDARPYRAAVTDVLLQVRVRPAPVGVKETLSRVWWRGKDMTRAVLSRNRS
jgi:hypothetical protein